MIIQSSFYFRCWPLYIFILKNILKTKSNNLKNSLLSFAYFIAISQLKIFFFTFCSTFKIIFFFNRELLLLIFFYFKIFIILISAMISYKLEHKTIFLVYNLTLSLFFFAASYICTTTNFFYI